ncbi:putative ABC transporter ATP-binding protein YheS [Fundidesulfovibrio magnetotacticus]|uniref:Putative ABC transporter ATP-binding protein YheS n=1 Tax=Fundidesulfovibrio magnetotacticus TaxID=2730080 RepID=A0A6V8LS38_9BACT|nr:ABC-F family ATP-binding cassette domain-containing protein [Fundidesulfovibrio magnetotacticus]GFK92606.1 putative ABC transporter ATP-binding protein YheS [Fundidesulfovibrio magnetotacticus]
MSKITIQNLSKSLGGRDLMSGFSMEAVSGMRLAVTGPNGCGKSTFLRLMAGEAEPDSGRVLLPPGARLGYVAQELGSSDLEEPLLAWVMSALPSWKEFWREWERASLERDERALESLSARQAEMEHSLGYNPEHRAKAILSGLGFEEKAWPHPVKLLSGGWRERAKLARVLVAGADVLLLDEPTNHLDIEAVEWLEQYLLCFNGVLIFVAHDRVFLDRVGTHVLFLGGDKPALRQGTFSEFLEWRAQTQQQMEAKAAQLSGAIGRQMAFVSRFRYKATKARQAQSKLKAVDKLQKELSGVAGNIERRRKTLDFKLPEPARADKNILSVADLEFAFPGGRSLWPRLTFNLYRGQKVALAGPNGAGKTTLLKCLTGELKPSGGTIRMGSQVRMGYFSQHQTEILRANETVMGEIRRLSDPRSSTEELCSVLGLFMLGEEYFERFVRDLSGGEKSRLVLASLFLARANFLVLDEPTNHLDLESREALVNALADYEGAILFVAHDRHLLAEAAEVIWTVGPEGLSEFLGGYEAYEAHLKAQASAACALSTGGRDKAMAKESREERQAAKRRQAEERNALSRQLKPLRERYAQLEGELEQAMTRQHDVEQVLAMPETYADAAKFSELSKEYHGLKEQGDALVLELADLEERIGELEARREAL